MPVYKTLSASNYLTSAPILTQVDAEVQIKFALELTMIAEVSTLVSIEKAVKPPTANRFSIN